MPPRRLSFPQGPALALCATALALAGGCLPWSVELPGASGFVRRGLDEAYGLSLTASGRSKISLLPLPRLSLTDVTLAASGPEGPVLASGGTITLQFSLAALLNGRIEVVSAAFVGTDISLPAFDDPRWSTTLKRLSDVTASEAVAHPRRITLQQARLTGSDPRNGSLQSAEAIDATLLWPPWSESVEFKGSFRWNAATAHFSLSKLRPVDFLTGHDTPVRAAASWETGSLAIDGSGHLGPAPGFTGRVSLQTPALSETLAWIDTDLALSPLIESLAVEGSVEIDHEGIRLPSLQVKADDTELVGAGSVEMAGGRPSIRATLDTDTLNLSPMLAGMLRAGSLEAIFGDGWASRPLAWRPFAGSDLDLRLSSNNAQFGPLPLDDVAASLLVRADAIDATLHKASLHGGSLKGRILLRSSGPAGEPGTELRATGTFERLDLSALQAELGDQSRIAGPARGNFTLASNGRDLGTLVERLNGRATISVEEGAVSGLDLAEALQHKEPPAPSLLARKTARTAFDRAQLSVAFRNGQGEIDEGALDGPSLSASLRGRISLVERTLLAQAILAQPGAPAQPATRSIAPAARPSATYVIAGPWSGITVQAKVQDKTQQDGGASPTGNTLALQPGVTRSGLPPLTRAYSP